ncbi:MAG: type II/IV secretion system ATPase subunit [Methanobacteriota archaeon]
MEAKLCPYGIQRKMESKTLTINCRNCPMGNSTLADETCRSNIFRILQKEHGVDRILLNHAFVKVFSGKELDILENLTRFIEGIDAYGHLRVPRREHEKCLSCTTERFQEIRSLIEQSHRDPVSTYYTLRGFCMRTLTSDPGCVECENELRTLFSEMVMKGDLDQFIPADQVGSDVFYTLYVRPYVRPGFVESYIQLEPPPDAVFVESYDVGVKGHRPINVSLYMLRSRPEKLYFIVPSEYDLPREELYLLEHVREYLSRHRPKDVSFMDAATAEEYFQRLGKQIIAQFIEEHNLSLDGTRIDYLADVFARYSAGFGILEDLLLDSRIQDIYVNAPVVNNPLHIVLDGEEYTSNIFLSDSDVDALASRFRTLSGRAFSEASPVLDMDLESYHTRVAAISNPLTPRGIAFALRRHRSKPWTLSHFIANHMLSPAAAGFLSFLIDGQASLLVAGSRGAGKTSLLSALMLEIPQRFRILTIEDTAEIPVDHLQRYGYKIQSLITKSISSGSASTEVDPTDALRTALRLGESVLVLGEVRGVEAKVLFEAMRVGAAGNLIMGTIHGSTTRDVYERVVYDIGVPSTSFKAVDAVVIAAPIRAEGGVERKRRVTQISEITKTGWSSTPDPDKIFQDIMVYDTARDELCPTDLLDMGQSQVIGSVARKWGITVEKALQNIRLRTEIKKTIVKQSTHNKELLEAPANRDANNAFWMFIEESKQQSGEVNYGDVQKKWMHWFQTYTG